jgi:hypothetical protein
MLLLVFLLYSIRFFLPYPSPVEGQLISNATSRPLFNAKVDLLDLDRNSITYGPTMTDSQKGLFVLDLVPGSGRPAYLRVTVQTCSTLDALVLNRFLPTKNAKVIKNEKGGTTLVVHSSCTQ